MFSTRSYEKELLDQPGIPFSDIKQNMRELDIINRRLGGHGINIKGLRQLLPAKQAKPVRILEIGCGDGNNLRQIAEWAKKNNIKIELTGADINAECIQYAQSIPENQTIRFICSDYRDLSLHETPDIIFSSLFCHHFTNKDVEHILRWKHQNATTGFFINDLHRHPMAYYSIKMLTRLFSKSYLVKNDAPLSVERSFTKKEWRELCSSAGIAAPRISWQWAFRWLIICRK